MFPSPPSPQPLCPYPHFSHYLLLDSLTTPPPTTPSLKSKAKTKANCSSKQQFWCGSIPQTCTRTVNSTHRPFHIREHHLVLFSSSTTWFCFHQTPPGSVFIKHHLVLFLSSTTWFYFHQTPPGSVFIKHHLVLFSSSTTWFCFHQALPGSIFINNFQLIVTLSCVEQLLAIASSHSLVVVIARPTDEGSGPSGNRESLISVRAEWKRLCWSLILCRCGRCGCPFSQSRWQRENRRCKWTGLVRCSVTSTLLSCSCPRTYSTRLSLPWHSSCLQMNILSPLPPPNPPPTSACSSLIAACLCNCYMLLQTKATHHSRRPCNSKASGSLWSGCVCEVKAMPPNVALLWHRHRQCM